MKDDTVKFTVKIPMRLVEQYAADNDVPVEKVIEMITGKKSQDPRPA